MEGFESLPPPLPRELPPAAPLAVLEAALTAPFFSLSLLKNLNLSSIEFLLPEDDEEVVEGLDDELLEEEVDEVELALVLLDCLSPPEPGRPRPMAVGMPEEEAPLVAAAALVWGPLLLLLPDAPLDTAEDEAEA